jgi:hypothetical protein
MVRARFRVLREMAQSFCGGESPSLLFEQQEKSVIEEETVILKRQMSEDRKRPLEDDDYDDEGEENGEDEDDKGEEEGEEDTNDDSREMSMRRGFLCPNSPHVCLFVCLDVVFNLIRLMWMAICCGKAFEL